MNTIPTTKTQLRQEVIDKIKRDPLLLGLICESLDISLDTVKRYLKANNPALCNIDVLAHISKRFSQTAEELTEEVPMGDTTTVY